MASQVEDQGASVLRAVTKGDGVALPLGPCRALWVGGTGDLSLVACGDTTAVTISAVPAGTVVPIKTKYVQNATTATLIVALY